MTYVGMCRPWLMTRTARPEITLAMRLAATAVLWPEAKSTVMRREFVVQSHQTRTLTCYGDYRRECSRSK